MEEGDKKPTTNGRSASWCIHYRSRIEQGSELHSLGIQRPRSREVQDGRLLRVDGMKLFPRD